MKIKRLFIALCMALSVITVTDIVNPVTYVSASTKVPAVKTLEMQFNEGGKKKKIKFKNLPKDATVTYTSKNKKVAKVTKYGYVYPKGEGSTTIVCKVKSGTSTYRLSQAVVVKKVESYYQASDDNREVVKKYVHVGENEKHITPDGIRYEDLVWCYGGQDDYVSSDYTHQFNCTLTYEDIINGARHDNTNDYHSTGTIVADPNYCCTTNQKIALYEFNTKTNSFDKTGKYLKMPENYWTSDDYDGDDIYADFNVIWVRFTCYKNDMPEYILVQDGHSDTALGWIKYNKKDWMNWDGVEQIIREWKYSDPIDKSYEVISSNQKIYDDHNGNQVIKNNIKKIWDAQIYDSSSFIPVSIMKKLGLGDENGFYDTVTASRSGCVLIDISDDIFFGITEDDRDCSFRKYELSTWEKYDIYRTVQIEIMYLPSSNAEKYGNYYIVTNSVLCDEKTGETYEVCRHTW